MTPERKEQLEARMKAVIQDRVKCLTRDYIDRRITQADLNGELEELSEIAACVGTTFLALNMAAVELAKASDFTTPQRFFTDPQSPPEPKPTVGGANA